MSTQIQYLGHASFKIQSEYCSMVIDPFFTGNPYACCTANDFIALDAMLLTHGHFDHIKDAVTIAKQTECMVICNAEMAAYLKSQGVNPETVSVMKVGETQNFPFAKVTMVAAKHPNEIHAEDGGKLPGGEPCGYVVEVDHHKVYHAGDTELIEDMKKLKEHGHRRGAASHRRNLHDGHGRRRESRRDDQPPRGDPHALQHLPQHHGRSSGFREESPLGHRRDGASVEREGDPLGAFLTFPSTGRTERLAFFFVPVFSFYIFPLC